MAGPISHLLGSVCSPGASHARGTQAKVFASEGCT